ncbi:MAG: cobaltochelatase subunit CobN, partial [Candidatus Methanomethylophilaceae archaeon]|nr:cobaltochelatase subunit CobN [Candidatus Methanomethylophilaceae archaeon]
LHADRPRICVLFHQKYWLVHNTAGIDGLLKSFERFDADVLPIFVVSHANPIIGSIGLPALVRKYLIRDGKPVVDVIVNTMSFSQTLISNPGDGVQVSDDQFFVDLGIPVLQASTLYCNVDEWKRSPQGMGAADIAMSIINPEFDGQIDMVPFSGTGADSTGALRNIPIPDRCDMIAESAYRWAKLKHIPNSGRKVAILVYMYPPRQDLAAGGYGLDTPESVASVLKSMSAAGYTLDWVPENGRELMDRLLEGVTNDNDWMSDEQMRKVAVDLVTPKQYMEWFSEIAESARKRYVECWGDAPGDQHVLDGNLLLPGILDGNVFVGFQPDRGKCTTEAIHDPYNAPPHQYLAFYRWLRDVWGADAVIHVGTHGTLEWLPGKGAGLSSECDPDIVLGCIPNINPYIIDNPGEGMQAKRRSYAVVTTHMIPAMTRSGGYREMDELEDAVQAFIKAREQDQGAKLRPIIENVIRIARDMNMLHDMDLPDDCTVEQMEGCADRLYDYVLEAKDAMIKDGLHVLGEVPDGQRMDETVYSLVRYANGMVPSIRQSVADAFGLEMNDLV